MGGQNQVKITKGHQMQIFITVFLIPYVQKKYFGISQVQVKVTNSHQVQKYMNSFKREIGIRFAQCLIFE